jgi:ER lumen protein retaining receptor
MKIFYVSVSALTICKIKFLEPIKSVYNADQDSFPHWTCAVLPSLMLGFAITTIQHGSLAILESLWTTSIFLESIAILPQLFVLRRYRLVENLTGKFMLCLGSYRVLYLLNWIYRSYTQEWYRHNYIVYIAGVIQSCMFVDFFIQYINISPLVPCCGRNGNEDDEDDDNEGLIFEISRTQEVRQHPRMGKVSSSEPLLMEDEDMTATSKDLVERRSRVTAEAKV